MNVLININVIFGTVISSTPRYISVAPVCNKYKEHCTNNSLID
ncbi:hypothetical protein Desaci_2074 [Desulfosporosinus acidiphilus SJ4]|uniref:Uncharacterized protein n=1 Tax=Desulfosporosinus acidiphilus (strain DSM 22704 / JCM 16185 / SJ4) TaxID=646529 RepID=I4D5H3_DESAJ|nr:hypothetical protein Desaci_2074 [Desulfosporosinus acidiphilus SJ4]